MRRHFPLSPATGLEDPAQLPWFDGDPVAGLDGSFPGSKLFTDMEAEILNAQRAAGLADSPDGADLAQLAEALSRGIQVVFGTTANTLAVAIQGGVTFTALRPGMKFYGFVQTANTAAVQAVVSGFGAGDGTYPVVRSDGSALAKGDLVLGGFIELRVNADATGFVCPNAALSVLNVIQSQFLITAPVTKTIALTGSPDFASPAAAITWLGKYLITPTGSVAFQMAAGQYVSAAALGWDHPNINRVTLKGTRILAAPTSLAVTGYSSAARATDANTNITTLRNVFQTELRFTGGVGITSVSPSPVFQDLLITGDGTGSEATGANLLDLNNAGTCRNVACWGSAGAGVRARGGLDLPTGSVLLISACGAFASGSFESDSGGQVVVAGTLVVAGGGSNGLSCIGGTIRRNGGTIQVSGHAIHGMNLQNSDYVGGGGAFTFNAVNGINAYLSKTDLFGTNAGGNGVWGLATDNGPAVARSMTFSPANATAGSGGGTISATGPAAQVDALNAAVNGTESPAINTTGNRGASIRT